MWGLSTLGLLLSLAAAVLLGLTTFGVPVNHSIWLLKVTLVDLDLKCGTLGYTLGDQDSRTRVGYDMPRKVGNEDISSITSVIHKLTYVLVCFPIVLLAFGGHFHHISLNMLGMICASLAALSACIAFALVIAIYFVLSNQFHSSQVSLEFGSAFYMGVIAAALLLFASGFLAFGVCCGSNARKDRKTKSDIFSPTMPSRPYERIGMQPVQAQPEASADDLPHFVEYDRKNMSGLDVTDLPPHGAPFRAYHAPDAYSDASMYEDSYDVDITRTGVDDGASSYAGVGTNHAPVLLPKPAPPPQRPALLPPMSSSAMYTDSSPQMYALTSPDTSAHGASRSEYEAEHESSNAVALTAASAAAGSSATATSPPQQQRPSGPTVSSSQANQWFLPGSDMLGPPSYSPPTRPVQLEKQAPL